MVSTDRLQPSSDWTRGHGAFRAAVSRSIQLLSRSADPAWNRPGGRRYARSFCGGEQTGRDDAIGLVLLDLVERRTAYGNLLSQHDWAADRIDRQSYADGDSISAAAPTCKGRSAFSDRAAKVALPPVD